jgi:hypothetical protein
VAPKLRTKEKEKRMKNEAEKKIEEDRRELSRQ